MRRLVKYPWINILMVLSIYFLSFFIQIQQMELGTLNIESLLFVLLLIISYMIEEDSIKRRLLLLLPMILFIPLWHKNLLDGTISSLLEILVLILIYVIIEKKDIFINTMILVVCNLKLGELINNNQTNTNEKLLILFFIICLYFIGVNKYYKFKKIETIVFSLYMLFIVMMDLNQSPLYLGVLIAIYLIEYVFKKYLQNSKIYTVIKYLWLIYGGWILLWLMLLMLAFSD